MHLYSSDLILYIGTIIDFGHTSKTRFLVKNPLILLDYRPFLVKKAINKYFSKKPENELSRRKMNQ